MCRLSNWNLPSLKRVSLNTSETGKPSHCNGHGFADIPCGARDVTIDTLVTLFQTTPLYIPPYIYIVPYNYPPPTTTIYLLIDSCYNVASLALTGISAKRSPSQAVATSQALSGHWKWPPAPQPEKPRARAVAGISAYGDHMARTIEFQADRLIKRIDALRGAQLPFAGNRALRQLGFQLRGELQREMRDKFKNPVPFTINSPRYSVDGLELTVSISKDGPKGQDPARYLYPVTGGGPAYITRFNRAIRTIGVVDASYYAIPFLKGRGVRKNTYGNMTPGQYQQVLSALKSDARRGSGKQGSVWRYFSVPDQRSAKPNTGRLKPGIYRAKSNDLQLLFTNARKHPKVPPLFDFEGVVERRSREIFPSILSKALDDALK